MFFVGLRDFWVAQHWRRVKIYLVGVLNAIILILNEFKFYLINFYSILSLYEQFLCF